MRFGRLAGVLALALWSATEAGAASITLGEWAVAPETIGNVTWTYTGSTNLPTSLPVLFVAGGFNLDDLVLNFPTALTAGTYTLEFSISLAGDSIFTGAEMLPTSDPGNSFTEIGTDLNLASLGGDASTTSVAGLTSVDVTGSFSVTTGEVAGVGYRFISTPEPGAAPLFAAGALGLVVYRQVRRRRGPPGYL